MATTSRSPIWAATENSIRAGRAAGRITGADAGAVAALRTMARQMDAELKETGTVKTTTANAYARFADALTLTPTSRLRQTPKPPARVIRPNDVDTPAQHLADDDNDDLAKLRKARGRAG